MTEVAVVAPGSVRLSQLLEEAMADEIAIAVPKLRVAQEIALLMEAALNAATPFLYVTNPLANRFREALLELDGEQARLVEEFIEAQDAIHHEREVKNRARREAERTEKHLLERLRPLIYARDGFRCVRCESTEKLTLDHIKPRSRGGETTAENLQTLCLTCNVRKGNR